MEPNKTEIIVAVIVIAGCGYLLWSIMKEEKTAELVEKVVKTVSDTVEKTAETVLPQ